MKNPGCSDTSLSPSSSGLGETALRVLNISAKASWSLGLAFSSLVNSITSGSLMLVGDFGMSIPSVDVTRCVEVVGRKDICDGSIEPTITPLSGDDDLKAGGWSFPENRGAISWASLKGDSHAAGAEKLPAEIDLMCCEDTDRGLGGILVPAIVPLDRARTSREGEA